MPKTPRLALGTMHFGTRLDHAASHELLDAYLDHGGQWIDTANCYAFWGSETGLGGQSERVIGEWLAKRRARDQVKLSTKVGAEPLRAGSYPDAVEGLETSTVNSAIKGSLDRLGVDSVDMYWAHKEDRTQTLDDVTATFASLVEEGLTERIGLSNHPAWYAAASIKHAEHLGLPAFSALQLRESYIHPRPDTPIEGQDHPNGMMTAETRDFARHQKIELWAYTPLLTGLYEHPERALPAAYEHPGTSARLEALKHWSRELGYKPSQLVLAHLLTQDPLVLPIVGVSRVEQVVEAIEATTLELPPEAVEALSAAGG